MTTTAAVKMQILNPLKPAYLKESVACNTAVGPKIRCFSDARPHTPSLGRNVFKLAVDAHSGGGDRPCPQIGAEASAVLEKF